MEWHAEVTLACIFIVKPLSNASTPSKPYIAVEVLGLDPIFVVAKRHIRYACCVMR